jgi:hypothetical protein
VGREHAFELVGHHRAENADDRLDARILQREVERGRDDVRRIAIASGRISDRELRCVDAENRTFGARFPREPSIAATDIDDIGLAPHGFEQRRQERVVVAFFEEAPPSTDRLVGRPRSAESMLATHEKVHVALPSDIERMTRRA